MNKTLKSIFITATLFLFSLAFSFSYTSYSIDNLVFVVAIGIDVGENSKLKVSFQFSNSSSIAASGSTEEDALIITSVEANSISSAINDLNSYLGKKLNLSHCKLIIFSAELASLGISDEIYALTNHIEIRPSSNIIISKCDAEVYIKNSKPNMEKLITKYYEFFPNSSKYTGYLYDATIDCFFNNLYSDIGEPYAMLGELIDSDSNISAKRKAQNLGLAVFKKDRLIGELSPIETLAFGIIQNKVDSFFITVEDPRDSDKTIDLSIACDKNLKIDVDIINDTPYIKVDCKFKGFIDSMSNDMEALDTKFIEDISNSANRYLENVISEFLYKTSREFDSDINNFGKKVLSKFLTLDDFHNFNWKNHYKNSFFKVSIDVNIQSGLLLIKT